jgi:hypothetical protein
MDRLTFTDESDISISKITQRIEQPAVKSQLAIERTRIEEMATGLAKSHAQVTNSSRIDACQRSTSIEAANS